MATSLARQLQSLAAPQTDHFVHQGRKKASLLFDPSEAANYDFKDIYGIGLAGLQELQLLPNGDVFSRLEAVLFSEVSQTVERSVRTEAVNRELDRSIEEFLREVSPYIMLSPAQKALEWLIARFHVHQYNIDAVMLAFLPYHETKLFVRMVQLLEFQFAKKWECFLGVQKKGVILTKKDLLKCLSKESWLLGVLCEEMIKHADDRPVELKPAAGERPSKSGNDVYCKFFASTILALLYEVREIDNPLIAGLLPCLSKCLQSEGRDYRLTAYAVIASLSQRIKLKEETNKLLALAVGEAITKHGDENGMKALSIIVTAQERTVLPEKVFCLFATKDFFKLAIKSINDAKLHNFFWIIFTTAAEMLFQAGNPSAENIVDFIGSFIKKVQLEHDIKAKIVRYIVKKTLEKKTDLTKIDLPLGRCLSKMREFDPATWSGVLNDQGTLNGNLLERLDLTFIQEADAINLTTTTPTTSMFLRLNHPNTALRMAAAKELVCASPTETLGLEFLRDALRDRLQDADPGVVGEILSDPERLLKLATALSLKEWLVGLLCRLETKEKREKWDRVEAAAVGVLARSGAVEDFLPFFLGAVFRRNIRMLECDAIRELFPNTLASLKEKLPLGKILVDTVDDLASRSGDSIYPSIQVVLALLENLEFPTTTALCTVSVLVEVVSRLGLFFVSSDACTILDCVQAFLKRVSVTDRVINEEHLEQSLSHVKKGKLSGAVILGWCSLLWENLVFDARTEPDALLRAAKFVLADCATVKDKIFKKALTAVFVVCVLKEIPILAALLTSVMKRPESKSSFCRNVLSLCAEAVLVMKVEAIEDGVMGEILSVAIPAMRHQDPRMRQSGLKLLENLKTRQKFLSSSEVKDLLHLILAGRDKIEQDEAATAQVLGDIFVGTSSSEATKTFWLDLLLQPVQSASELIRLNVLIALRLVKPFAVFMKLQLMVDQLIGNYSQLESGLEVRILNECLERLTPHACGARFPLIPEAEKHVIKTMLGALSLPGRFNVEAPAEVVLRQMFFMGPAHLGEDLYNRVLQEILRVYVEKSNPTCQTAFRKYLKHVRIPGRLIIAQINDQGIEAKSTGKRLSGQGLARLNNPTRQTKAFWHRAGAVLEVIQAKKKISDVNPLIKELFDLAKETVVLDQNADLLEELELVRRLIFSTINFHCKRAQGETNGSSQDSLKMDSSVFDVPAVVECIRSSTDSQTHLSALVLLSTLATIMPANVLQNCMTIFTLTGNKLLHKDDQYSVEVVGRTIDVIVPVMLQANTTTTGQQHNAVRAVLELFVDTLPHMPVQRRQLLFQRLLKVANGGENLWILVVLLMNVYTAKALSVEDEDLMRRKSYPVLCEFLEHLFEGMPLEEQVKNLQQATEYILSASSPAKSGTPSKKLKTLSSTFEKPLINGNFTPEELIRLTTAMVTFIGYQIPSHSFRATYTKQTQTNSLDRCLEQLLVSLLDIQTRARQHSRTKEGPAWLELLRRTSVAVTEILGQMSWASFVGVMRGILKDETPSMVKTALEELGGTLGLRGAVGKAEAGQLVPLVEVLVGILRQSGEQTAEVAGVKRGCLFSLKQLAGILGTHSPDTWPTIMKASSELLDNPDLLIRCEAVSCLTAVVSTVKTAVLPRLPEFLPRLLEHVHQILLAKAQDAVALLTAMEALEAVITCLTAFISPQLPKILAMVALCSVKSVKPTVKDAFAGKLLKIRGILCGDVPFRVMFSAFKETYGAVKQTEVFNIFNDSLKKAKTGDILSMQRDIVDFLFTVFDTRHDLPAALDSLSLLALRMPESSFKGLFMKLYQWATQDGLQRKKLFTFYQIVDRLTDTLKHMFVIYAATVISHAVGTMSSFHVEKRAAASKDDEKETETDILVTILDVLTKFFKYDTTGYFNADQCDVLNQPLVDQLDNYRDAESYGKLVQHLIAAITAFAVSLNDDSLWKPLHYQVLLKTRHDESAVRVAALQVIEALVESIGEAYSNLLPEAVTFLVELSAEDDELVESQCAQTKATIERVLGDSTIWKNEID